MSSTNITTEIKKIYKFRCPDCQLKFTSIESLINHIDEKHKDKIPDGISTKRYIFNRKYNKTIGECVIDKLETLWNEDKGHYERYCSDRCRLIARRRFVNNCKRTLGTENPAADPEHQMKAIKGRSNSGVYTFKSSGIIGYSSSYELDFLKFIDEDMSIKSSEIEQCSIIFNIIMDNVKKFHIPDFYMPTYNLIINIKDGGDNPNNNPNVAGDGHLRQRLADASIITNGHYNYIKIVNKEYANFVNLIELITKKSFSSESNLKNVIISIPE